MYSAGQICYEKFAADREKFNEVMPSWDSLDGKTRMSWQYAAHQTIHEIVNRGIHMR